MECPKCGGFMTSDKFIDLMGGCAHFLGWRCVSCGKIIDPLIAENRENRPYPRPIGPMKVRIN